MNLRAVAAVTIGTLTIGIPAATLLADAPTINITIDTIGVHHPDCEGAVVDIAPGEPTPIAGTVWVKAGPFHFNVGPQPAGYIAGPQDGYAVSHVDVCPPTGTTTSTTTPPSSTTTTSPTTSSSTTTTTTCPDCVPNTQVNNPTTTEVTTSTVAGPTTTATGATTTTATTSPSSTSSPPPPTSSTPTTTSTTSTSTPSPQLPPTR